MIINGMPDHLHLLIGFNPDCALSNLVRDIKANSSKFINDKRWVMGKFSWQTGFGGFTIGQSQIAETAKYIEYQELHHKKKSFRQEYLDFLKAYKIEFKTNYLFAEIE